MLFCGSAPTGTYILWRLQVTHQLLPHPRDSAVPVDINPFDLHPKGGIQVLVFGQFIGEEMSTEGLSKLFKLTQQEDHRKLPGFGGPALDLPLSLWWGSSGSCHSRRVKNLFL